MNTSIESTENFLLKQFAEFVKAKRQALGKTQAELALEVFGNTEARKYISGIETGGKKGLTIATMEKILKVLKSEINFTEK